MAEKLNSFDQKVLMGAAASAVLIGVAWAIAGTLGFGDMSNVFAQGATAGIGITTVGGLLGSWLAGSRITNPRTSAA